jgi:hypothetical protein
MYPSVVAYTYEADIHCLTCAGKRFEENEHCELVGTDNEGNPIHPVFNTDEFPNPEYCGTCGEEI